MKNTNLDHPEKLTFQVLSTSSENMSAIASCLFAVALRYILLGSHRAGNTHLQELVACTGVGPWMHLLQHHTPQSQNTKRIWTVDPCLRFKFSRHVRFTCHHTVFPRSCLCLPARGEAAYSKKIHRSCDFFVTQLCGLQGKLTVAARAWSGNWITGIFLSSIYHSISSS